MRRRPLSGNAAAQVLERVAAQADHGRFRSSFGRTGWRTLRKDPFAMVSLAGLVLVVLATLLAPWIAPYDPVKFDRQYRLAAPSNIHLWGTDDLGRDVLSRVLWGGRESLRVAALGLLIGMGGGTIVGLISAYYGGRVDSLVQRTVEILLAFPTILLVLALVAIIGSGLSTVLIALGVANIPRYTRLVRGSALAAKNRDYVVAARALGASDLRIMLSHILPNILAPIIIYSTLGLGAAITVTAGLSYLGLGAQPPSPEWGAMLNYGRQFMRDAWWMSIFPGLAIFFVVLCVNILGDGLRDALDPRLHF